MADARRVLFIGDVNVDLVFGGLESPVLQDREVTCGSFEVTVGSAAAIAACSYASLGGQASLLGLAGNDEYGRYMIEQMRSFGVNTELVRWTDTVKTGVTVNLIYRETRSQVTYPGTIAELTEEGIDERVLSRFAHLHFAGPYQQTRFRPHIGRLLRLARRLGSSTSLDPQWDASQRWEGMQEWLPELSYLFLNEDEARSISGCSSVEEACRLLAGRTATVLVKAGREGAYLCTAGGEPGRLPGFPVSVVDTTGAGDNFDAGFLFAVLEKEMEPAEACRFANAVAARSCLYAGGVNARSSYVDVLRFIEERSNENA
jgi:ribokinase